MSRRLRAEEERARHLKAGDDLELIVDKLTIWTERANAPMMWKKTESGFRIEDCQETQFKEVLQIFKDYYMPYEVLCKNTELMNDPESVECFLERLLFNLKDKASIIAIDENYVEPEGEEEECEEADKAQKEKKKEPKVKIAGVLVLRVITRSDYGRIFSRVQLVRGEALKTCIGFKNHINRNADVYSKYNCDAFLRYYDLCILPEYRHKRLGHEMMLTGLDVARLMDVPVVMGLFSSISLQKTARKIGMETVFYMNYTEWRDAEGEYIFDDPGAGNYSCDLMAGPVPPPAYPETPKSNEEVAVVGKKKKTTRAEKRALKAYNAKCLFKSSNKN